MFDHIATTSTNSLRFVTYKQICLKSLLLRAMFLNRRNGQPNSCKLVFVLQQHVIAGSDWELGLLILAIDIGSLESNFGLKNLD